MIDNGNFQLTIFVDAILEGLDTYQWLAFDRTSSARSRDMCNNAFATAAEENTAIA